MREGRGGGSNNGNSNRVRLCDRPKVKIDHRRVVIDQIFRFLRILNYTSVAQLAGMNYSKSWDI